MQHLPLEAFVEMRRPLLAAYVAARHDLSPFYRQLPREEIREFDIWSNPLTEHELDSIPGFRAAFEHKEKAKNDWAAFENELSKRMSPMNFTYLLQQWRATYEQDENCALADAYLAAVRERLDFIFSHCTFEQWFNNENWAKLSTLDLPFMLTNAQEWEEWYRQPDNEDFFFRCMRWPPESESRIALLTAAIQRVRAYHEPRTMAFLMGTHRRAPAGIGKLDPLILREITRSARAPSEFYPRHMDPLDYF